MLHRGHLASGEHVLIHIVLESSEELIGILVLCRVDCSLGTRGKSD